MSAVAVADGVETGGRGGVGVAGLLLLGLFFWVVFRQYPAELPFFLPWEFSWPVFLATSLSLAWFFIGLRRLSATPPPPLWRSICFVTGVLWLYVMVQTHIDYYAQHMFFIHRA